MRRRLLVVDDDVSFLFSLRKLLEGTDMKVDTAETLVDAFRLIDANRYDAVISDVRLTGSRSQEGLVILARVKRKSVGTKVIILTGYGTPDIKRLACEMGADAYLEKPVTFDGLTEALEIVGVRT